MYHASLEEILSSLKEGMTTPQLRRCPDGYFSWIIYGLGPYVADYPEQVLLTTIVQNWCPKYIVESLFSEHHLIGIDC